MICLRSKQLAIDLCVCECVCVCIMVMSRNVDFHVRQQRSLLTPLLPILLLFVYVCLCVCLSVAAISRPEQFLYSSFWLFLFFQAYSCLIVPLPELADINTHKQWGKWNAKNPPPHILQADSALSQESCRNYRIKTVPKQKWATVFKTLQSCK